MEIEINGKEIKIRDMLFKEKREYIKNVMALSKRIDEKDYSAIEELYDYRLKVLCNLSNNELNFDILNELSASFVDSILIKLDNYISTGEEIKKK